MDDSIDEVLDAEYARVEAIDAGLDAYHQLTKSGPLRIIIDEARRDALIALDMLVKVDPNEAKEIRELQWAVTRYDDLCRWIARIIETSKQASEDLTAEQAAELARLLHGDEANTEDA